MTVREVRSKLQEFVAIKEDQDSIGAHFEHIGANHFIRITPFERGEKNSNLPHAFIAPKDLRKTIELLQVFADQIGV